MRYSENDYTKINPSKSQKIAVNRRVYFTKKGSEDDFADVNGKKYPIIQSQDLDVETKSFAKYVQNNDYMTYWVKVSRNGRLYNPYGLNRATERKRRIKPEWRFRKVNESVFLSYIEFLRTKQESYLNQAERDRV